MFRLGRKGRGGGTHQSDKVTPMNYIVYETNEMMEIVDWYTSSVFHYYVKTLCITHPENISDVKQYFERRFKDEGCQLDTIYNISYTRWVDYELS